VEGNADVGVDTVVIVATTTPPDKGVIVATGVTVGWVVAVGVEVGCPVMVGVVVLVAVRDGVGVAVAVAVAVAVCEKFAVTDLLVFIVITHVVPEGASQPDQSLNT
jgi:hypothetical protein